MLTVSSYPRTNNSVTALSLGLHVATTRYLQKYTKIPVPEIFFYDSGVENPLGAAFLVTEFIDGIPLSHSGFYDQSQEVKGTIFAEVSRISYKLSALRFKQIGALFTAENSDG